MYLCSRWFCYHKSGRNQELAVASGSSSVDTAYSDAGGAKLARHHMVLNVETIQHLCIERAQPLWRDLEPALSVHFHFDVDKRHGYDVFQLLL